MNAARRARYTTILEDPNWAPLTIGINPKDTQRFAYDKHRVKKNFALNQSRQLVIITRAHEEVGHEATVSRRTAR